MSKLFWLIKTLGCCVSGGLKYVQPPILLGTIDDGEMDTIDLYLGAIDFDSEPFLEHGHRHWHGIGNGSAALECNRMTAMGTELGTAVGTGTAIGTALGTFLIGNDGE